jgi:hypothetical protein
VNDGYGGYFRTEGGESVRRDEEVDFIFFKNAGQSEFKPKDPKEGMSCLRKSMEKGNIRK